MIYVNLIKERKNREYTNDIARKVASSESETHQTWSTNQMKKKCCLHYKKLCLLMSSNTFETASRYVCSAGCFKCNNIDN